MGIADFPIEIFKTVKHKHQHSHSHSFKTESRDSPKESNASISSGSDTPPFASRSQSQHDVGLDDENIDDLSPEAFQPPFQQATTSAFSPRTSHESVGRSSTEARGTDTPLTSTTSIGEHRGGSLRQALRGTLTRSRSTSRNRGSCRLGRSNSSDRRPDSRASSRTREAQVFDPSKLTLDNALGAAKGAHRIVAAGMKSPMDFTLGLARGFHNAPKLYGDDTVRPQEKVTDLQSGLKAAGKVSQLGILSCCILLYIADE